MQIYKLQRGIKLVMIPIVFIFLLTLCFVSCGDNLDHNILLEMSFDRNDTLLISEIRITGNDLNENEKDIIFNTMIIDPPFKYNAEWIDKMGGGGGIINKTEYNFRGIDKISNYYRR
jgi:hypothetical protein